MKPRVIPGAVKAAMIDHIKGLKPSPSRHDAVEGSAWADEYRLTYDRLTKNNSQPKVNSAQSISEFLAEHSKVPVRFEGHLLTPTEAQAKLALSKYADATFSIFLRRHLLEIIRE